MTDLAADHDHFRVDLRPRWVALTATLTVRVLSHGALAVLALERNVPRRRRVRSAGSCPRR